MERMTILKNSYRHGIFIGGEILTFFKGRDFVRRDFGLAGFWRRDFGLLRQNQLFSVLPFPAHQILASATFVDLLREDCFFNGRMGKEFAMSGSLNCVDDTLARLQQHRKQQQQQHPSMMGGGHEADYLIGALKSLVTMAAKHSRTFPLS
jgi:hypothetical protein